MLLKTRVERCEACGADIVFIKVRGNKFVPSDAEPIIYREDATGDKTIITLNGEVIRCTYNPAPGAATGKGYAPHWQSCTAPDRF